jgi:hypothetical protein
LAAVRVSSTAAAPRAGGEGEIEMNKLICSTALALMSATTSSALARPHAQSREGRLVACLIGQASISLHRQLGTKVDATRAADIAVMYASKSKACKGSLSEGGLDVVQASVDAMAKIWFEDEAPTPPAAPKPDEPEPVEPSLKLWDQLSK